MNRRRRLFRLIALIALPVAVGIATLDGCRYEDRGGARPGTGAGSSSGGTVAAGSSEDEALCARGGWEKLTFTAGGRSRDLMWKAPSGSWRNGAILVLHGGGSASTHFCGAGGRIARPQGEFTRMALDRGFAVFALNATVDVVTDEAGRACGKRFDFSVLPRPNVDLPYIEKIIGEIIPARRPAGSNPSLFITGLSTGGYMTTRAATHFSGEFTAFAPVAAGDPYGTDTNCDTSLSRRKSAKGVLLDRDTRKKITEGAACASSRGYGNEARWDGGGGRKPVYRQFHDANDGIVDVSCMRKLNDMLKEKGYTGRAPYLIPASGGRNVFKHLWQMPYNEPILKFFEQQASRNAG